MMMTLAQAHQLLPGSVLVGEARTAVERVHSDSRTVRAGDLFVALRGERFDAHDFLTSARERGAAAGLAERGLAEAGLPGLQVPDTLHALQTLAAAWRQRFHLPLIAVTGSNGKTTVTQMVASILRAWVGDGALATAGNFNNHIGVPLTLLRLRQDDEAWHRAAVLELGMNHPGEIGVLARLAAPTVALVNNAQREHQEFMDGVEAVARENGSVLQALPGSGVAVFPADDPWAGLWRQMAGSRRVLCFATDASAEVRGAAERTDSGWSLEVSTPGGAFTTTLAVPGRHNVRNALAAAACALAAGAPLSAVRDGLAAFVPVAGRSRPQTLRLRGRALTLLDDSYNANPDSVLAAIDMLADLPAPRWLVLGDMGEVGEQGAAFHREVGLHARGRGLEHLWCAGPLSAHAAEAFGAAARHFADTQALVAAISTHAASSGGIPPAGSVLVKGSRFMAMERVVQALRAVESAGDSDAA